MTLISIHEGGRSKRRCDAKCYEAEKKKCRCCCGGMNHGRGLEKAKDLMLYFSNPLAERWGREHPGEKMVISPIQQDLFDQERRTKNA